MFFFKKSVLSTWPKGIIFGDFHSFFRGIFWFLASLREQRRRTGFFASFGRDLPRGGALALIGGFLGSYELSGDSNRRLSALRAGRVAEVLALLLNFSGALVGLGSYEPSGDSSRRLSALRAGRFFAGDARRVIRAASGRARSRPDAAGKLGSTLTLIDGFIGSPRFARDASRRFWRCC